MYVKVGVFLRLYNVLYCINYTKHFPYFELLEDMETAILINVVSITLK